MLSSPDCILTLSDRVMWVLDIFQRLLSFWISALTRRPAFILYDVGATLALKKLMQYGYSVRVAFTFSIDYLNINNYMDKSLYCFWLLVVL